MKKEIFFASGLIILIIFSFFYIENINEKKEQISTINTCNDGTFYDTCSLTKPYYCQDGILIEKSSLCGCSELSGISQGDSCDLNYKGIKTVLSSSPSRKMFLNSSHFRHTSSTILTRKGVNK